MRRKTQPPNQPPLRGRWAEPHPPPRLCRDPIRCGFPATEFDRLRPRALSDAPAPPDGAGPSGQFQATLSLRDGFKIDADWDQVPSRAELDQVGEQIRSGLTKI